jgi:hypothetical protein
MVNELPCDKLQFEDFKVDDLPFDDFKVDDLLFDELPFDEYTLYHVHIPGVKILQALMLNHRANACSCLVKSELCDFFTN